VAAQSEKIRGGLKTSKGDVPVIRAGHRASRLIR
jgi:hypothetical protein